MRLSIQAFADHADTANALARRALAATLTAADSANPNYRITQEDIACMLRALREIFANLESATNPKPTMKGETPDERDTRRRAQEAALYEAQRWISTVARLNNLTEPT